MSVSDAQHIPQSLWWQISHHFDHELSLEVSPCTCALIVYRQLRECHSYYNSLLYKVLVFPFPINIELKFSGLYKFLQILVDSIRKEISLALLSATVCNKFTEIGVVPILNLWNWEENETSSLSWLEQMSSDDFKELLLHYYLCYYTCHYKENYNRAEPIL